jgi:uncharacterized protein YegL
MLARTCLLIAGLLIASPAVAQQNVVIVLDDSGSMGDPMRSDRSTRKIDAAKKALHAVLEQLPEDSRVGLVVLNGGRGGWLIPLGPVDTQGLDNTINRIRANGGTPLGKHMKVAADALLEARSKQTYGTFKLLIVTDGEAGDKKLVEQYLPDILSRGLVVDVIGVDMQQNHSLATQVQTYRKADDPASLEQAISEVVLGESTADDSAAGESDFEVLAGLPDEVAIAALDALCTMCAGSYPIGEQPVNTNTPPGTDVAQAQTPPSATATSSGRTASVPGSSRNQGVGGARMSVLSVFGVCCVGGFVVMLIVVVGVVLVVKK